MKISEKLYFANQRYKWFEINAFSNVKKQQSKIAVFREKAEKRSLSHI